MYILAINPGSTSTKLSVYQDDKEILTKSVTHDSSEISKYAHIWDQFEFRMEAINEALKDFDLKKLDAVVGRGGMLKPLESGTYIVNENMINYLKNRTRGEHASNLGCIIAKTIADPLNIPSYIVDPVAVDEMDDIARYTGMPEIKRQSIFHALNHKAVSYRAAKDLNKDYKELNLIVAHLGGGISVAAHEKGRVIDVNNALDGDGPMSPERSGTVPLGPLYKMAFSGKYTLDEIKRKNYGKGGLVAYLGTNDGREITRRIQEGDVQAKFMFEVMCYQIAKEIGSTATVLKGKVDAIILTGGLAYNKIAIDLISERISFIGKIIVYPGEDEMRSLVEGAIRVLKKEEEPKEYE